MNKETKKLVQENPDAVWGLFSHFMEEAQKHIKPSQETTERLDTIEELTESRHNDNKCKMVKMQTSIDKQKTTIDEIKTRIEPITQMSNTVVNGSKLLKWVASTLLALGAIITIITQAIKHLK